MEYRRIKKQADFQKLFSKGKRLFSASLTILYVPYKETRMGISVWKKHGKACTRNRVKRLLREAFRKNVPTLKKTYSFILLPKPKDDYSFKEYDEAIQKAFRKGDL